MRCQWCLSAPAGYPIFRPSSRTQQRSPTCKSELRREDDVCSRHLPVFFPSPPPNPSPRCIFCCCLCVDDDTHLQIELEFPPVRGKLDISLGEVRGMHVYLLT